MAIFQIRQFGGSASTETTFTLPGGHGRALLVNNGQPPIIAQPSMLGIGILGRLHGFGGFLRRLLVIEHPAASFQQLHVRIFLQLIFDGLHALLEVGALWLPPRIAIVPFSPIALASSSMTLVPHAVSSVP